MGWTQSIPVPQQWPQPPLLQQLPPPQQPPQQQPPLPPPPPLQQLPLLLPQQQPPQPPLQLRPPLQVAPTPVRILTSPYPAPRPVSTSPRTPSSSMTLWPAVRPREPPSHPSQILRRRPPPSL